MKVLGSRRSVVPLVGLFALFFLGTPSVSAHTFTASSQISIAYAGGAFQGRVSSSESDCESGRQVNLYEAVEGPDPIVGSATTDGAGNWSIPASGDGMFYAVAPAATDSSYTHFHDCGGANSDTVVVEGGQQVGVLGASQTPFRDAASGGPEVLGAGQTGGNGSGGTTAGGSGEVGAGGDGRGAEVWGVKLPFTGGDLVPYAAAGVVLIAGGATLLILRRRRRSAPPPPPPRSGPPPPPPAGHNGNGVSLPSLESPHAMYDSQPVRNGGASPLSTPVEREGSYVEPITDQYGPTDLREYVGVISARKWTVVLITVLVAGAALAYSLRQTPLYMAQSRVLVNPAGGGQTTSPTMSTETQLVASEQVAALVAEDLGADAGGLLGGLSVEAVGDSQVLAVSYTSDDPEFAAEAADSFATNYIELREQEAMDTLVAERRDAQRRIGSVEDDLNDVLNRMKAARAANNEGRLDELQAEELSLSARLGVLQQQLDDLKSQESLQAGMGRVIAQADVPGAPFSPDHKTNVLLGLLFGLGLGIGVAFIRRQLDTRFEARTDIERALGAPVLATITKFKVKKGEPWPVVTISRPRESASEAYRGLRTNLQVLMDSKGYRSLLVTSPSAGEGKTVTAANLAVSFAQSGRRVALVSADLRRPRVELYFRIRSDFGGLSEWLAGLHEAPTLVASGVPNLDILPSGSPPSNPAELLTSTRLGRLVEELKRNYHLIIFDSAPLLPVADAVGLGYQVDATLMVVHAAATNQSTAEHAREKLERVNARLVGAVLNAYDPSLPYYFHELDYYYAAEHFATDEVTPSNGAGRHRDKARGRRLFNRH